MNKDLLKKILLATQYDNQSKNENFLIDQNEYNNKNNNVAIIKDDEEKNTHFGKRWIQNIYTTYNLVKENEKMEFEVFEEEIDRIKSFRKTNCYEIIEIDNFFKSFIGLTSLVNDIFMKVHKFHIEINIQNNIEQKGFFGMVLFSKTPFFKFKIKNFYDKDNSKRIICLFLLKWIFPEFFCVAKRNVLLNDIDLNLFDKILKNSQIFNDFKDLVQKEENEIERILDKRFKPIIEKNTETKSNKFNEHSLYGKDIDIEKLVLLKIDQQQKENILLKTLEKKKVFLYQKINKNFIKKKKEINKQNNENLISSIENTDSNKEKIIKNRIIDKNEENMNEINKILKDYKFELYKNINFNFKPVEDDEKENFKNNIYDFKNNFKIFENHEFKKYKFLHLSNIPECEANTCFKELFRIFKNLLKKSENETFTFETNFLDNRYNFKLKRDSEVLASTFIQNARLKHTIFFKILFFDIFHQKIQLI